ncbi:hypothetical protein ACFV9P_14895 [Streptomyces sp. NPDC059892]|uniref:hypothetical protein n=1 Tax=Streptomyces sp. NPDC059892 TaxID=3346989 RepID=UPI003655DE8B
MAAPQLIVVSPRGSGTPLLTEFTTALGYSSYGTMSEVRPAGDERPGSGTGPRPGTGAGPGPGEVYPLLVASYGQDRAVRLLRRRDEERDDERDELRSAFQEAVSALWRVWWTRLGQPVTLTSPLDPDLEGRLARVPDSELHRLLPGRGCWYVTGLDLQRAEAGFLRAWHAEGQPPVIFHDRDVRDRIISQIQLLSGPAERVGSLPDHLIYRDIVRALPTMDARITLALTDPAFPGMEETRRCQWLARHPAVTVITHEELAGPAHGGTTEAREEAVTRLLRATGHPSLALDLPSPSPDLPSPRAGGGDDLEVGVWRRHFTPAHERILARLHSDLLTGPSALPARSN